MDAKLSDSEISVDEHLVSNAGVIYQVRFIATIHIRMQFTDLEKKDKKYLLNVIKECISKGCEKSHLKLKPKCGKSDIARKLEDVSKKNMVDANLEISEESVTVSEFEAHHEKIHDVCSSDVLAVSMGDISSLDCIGILVKQTLDLSCLVIQSLDGFITDEIQAAVKPAVLQFKSRRRFTVPNISGRLGYSNTSHSRKSRDGGISTELPPALRKSCLEEPIVINPPSTHTDSLQPIQEDNYDNPEKNQQILPPSASVATAGIQEDIYDNPENNQQILPPSVPVATPVIEEDIYDNPENNQQILPPSASVATPEIDEPIYAIPADDIKVKVVPEPVSPEQEAIPEMKEADNVNHDDNEEILQPARSVAPDDDLKFIAYLGDLPSGTDDVDIYKWLHDVEICHVELVYEKGIFSRAAKVEFPDASSMQTALTKSGLVNGETRFSIYGHPPTPKLYDDIVIPNVEENVYGDPDDYIDQPSAAVGPTETEKFIAYLGDLPSGTDDVDIYNWLNDVEVCHVELVYEQGIFSRAAKVEFADASSMQKALRQSGLVHGERRFSIHAHPQPTGNSECTIPSATETQPTIPNKPIPKPRHRLTINPEVPLQSTRAD